MSHHHRDLEPSVEQGHESRQRILVASGDPALRERLYDVLRRKGYAVTTAASGHAGVQLLQHWRPQLIVVENVNGDGMALAEHVRTFDAQLPIVLLGPLDHERMDPNAVRSIQACLPSTVSEQALLEAMVRWLPPDRSGESIDYPGSILIVDDEPELLSEMEAFLQPRGCSVVTASSGEDALAQLLRRRPTLVLLDIKMPGMDGLVTLKKIKDARPDLPVIMATAIEDRELMAQAFVLGAYDYVTKPYDLPALETLLLYLKKPRPSAPS